MSYWETLFDRRFMWDSEWKQRRDIIGVEEAVDAAQSQSAAALSQITTLQKQVHDLSVTVMALVELLADANHLDTQELRARVEAAVIGERAAVREHAQHGSSALLVCTQCQNRIPANRTTMTATGVVCDNCAR